LKLPPLGLKFLLCSGNSKDEVKRDYLGCSIAGGPCDRQLFYEYNLTPPKVDARIQRLFDLGSAIETLVIKHLRDCGVVVFDKDDKGNQWVADFPDKRIGGHLDGVVMNLPESSRPHLLEVKSANDSSFNKAQKEGVKEWNKQYYAQVQLYMMATGLERCLFIVYNKDNSELYIERLNYNKIEAEIFYQRAVSILDMKEPPDRPFPDKSYFICKFCKWKEECWKTQT
jgi:hypothetical protein